MVPILWVGLGFIYYTQELKGQPFHDQNLDNVTFFMLLLPHFAHAIDATRQESITHTARHFLSLSSHSLRTHYYDWLNKSSTFFMPRKSRWKWVNNMRWWLISTSVWPGHRISLSRSFFGTSKNKFYAFQKYRFAMNPVNIYISHTFVLLLYYYLLRWWFGLAL